MHSQVEIAVIVLTFNRAARTLRCLESLKKVSEPPHRVVLWDNASTDGTAEMVRKKFPDVFVHEHSSNLGVASGRNAAAQLAIDLDNPRYLMFLDNDTVVTPGFLSELWSAIDCDSKVAQAQPKLRFISHPDRIIDGGGCRISFWRGVTAPIGFGELDLGQYDRIRPCVGGGCTLVRTKTFKQLDGFDSRFDPYGPEDLDFSLRLSKKDYLCLYVPRAVIFHDQALTVRDFSESYAHNRARHWLTLLREHASMLESIGFFLVGAPVALARFFVREIRRGNIKALRGLLSGATSYFFDQDRLPFSKKS